MDARKLKNEKIEEYKQQLLKEKEETLKVIRDISHLQSKGVKNENGDLSSFSTHQADQGSDSDSLEKEVHHLESLQNKLKEINQALKRIFEGSYSICEWCGSAIEQKRLKVVPYANMCIKCKTEQENKKKRKR